MDRNLHRRAHRLNPVRNDELKNLNNIINAKKISILAMFRWLFIRYPIEFFLKGKLFMEKGI